MWALLNATSSIRCRSKWTWRMFFLIWITIRQAIRHIILISRVGNHYFNSWAYIRGTILDYLNSTASSLVSKPHNRNFHNVHQRSKHFSCILLSAALFSASYFTVDVKFFSARWNTILKHYTKIYNILKAKRTERFAVTGFLSASWLLPSVAEAGSIEASLFHVAVGPRFMGVCRLHNLDHKTATLVLQFEFGMVTESRLTRWVLSAS